MIYPELIKKLKEQGLSCEEIAYNQKLPVEAVKRVIEQSTGDGTKICCYCGKPIDTPDSPSNNADDYLHRETLNRSCCSQCDKLIVQTSRIIADTYIRRGNLTDACNKIKAALSKLT